MTDPPLSAQEALANLERGLRRHGCVYCESALEEVRAALLVAQQERDEALEALDDVSQFPRETVFAWKRRAESAERERDEVVKDRDDFASGAWGSSAAMIVALKHRAEQAEAALLVAQQECDAFYGAAEANNRRAERAEAAHERIAKEKLRLARDKRKAEATVARLREALKAAREGFREAYDYGCAWPIGTSDEPQEQRGMARDTFIINMELYGEQVAAALTQNAEARAGEGTSG